MYCIGGCGHEDCNTPEGSHCGDDLRFTLENILLFSLPLMMTQVLEVLFNLSDVAIAGKYAYNTYVALGSVGSTTTLVTLFTGLLIGLGGGVNVAVARGLGMGNDEDVEHTTHSSFLICLAMGVLTCLVCVFLPSLCCGCCTPRRNSSPARCCT